MIVDVGDDDDDDEHKKREYVKPSQSVVDPAKTGYGSFK